MADMTEGQIAEYAKKAVETAIRDGYIVIPERKELMASRTMASEIRSSLGLQGDLKPIPGKDDFISKTIENFKNSLNELPQGTITRYNDSAFSARANALLKAANDAKRELAETNPGMSKITTNPVVGFMVKKPLTEKLWIQLPEQVLAKEKGQPLFRS